MLEPLNSKLLMQVTPTVPARPTSLLLTLPSITVSEGNKLRANVETRMNVDSSSVERNGKDNLNRSPEKHG